MITLDKLKLAYPEVARTLYRDGTDLASSPSSTQIVYDTIAPIYDSFMREALGWRPEFALPLLTQRVQSHAAILEIGAGTGLLGRELHNLGFHNLRGLDLSPKMLELATASGVYQDLIRASISDLLPYEAGVFDALMCVGVLMHVRYPPALREFARIVRQEGYVILANRIDTFESFGYLSEAQVMIKDGLWTLVHSAIRNYCIGVVEYVETPGLHYCENVYRIN